MADPIQVGTEEPEVLRQQMQDTRSSLTEKLETLEQKVSTTVDEARCAVTDTVAAVKDSVQGSVATVKETVQSSVESVKETFDLSRQVREHPWGMICGSVTAGFLGGWLLGGSSRRSAAPGGGPAVFTAPELQVPPARRSFAAEMPPSAPEGPSWLSRVASNLEPEVEKLKGLAIGTLGSVVRDLLVQSVPDNFKDKLKTLADEFTGKLGGEPIAGRVLPESPPPASESYTGQRPAAATLP